MSNKELDRVEAFKARYGNRVPTSNSKATPIKEAGTAAEPEPSADDGQDKPPLTPCRVFGTLRRSQVSGAIAMVLYLYRDCDFALTLTQIKDAAGIKPTTCSPSTVSAALTSMVENKYALRYGTPRNYLYKWSGQFFYPFPEYDMGDDHRVKLRPTKDRKFAPVEKALQVPTAEESKDSTVTFSPNEVQALQGQPIVRRILVDWYDGLLKVLTGDTAKAVAARRSILLDTLKESPEPIRLDVERSRALLRLIQAAKSGRETMEDEVLNAYWALPPGTEQALAAVAYNCEVNMLSSRCCIMGTKGCDKVHSP